MKGLPAALLLAVVVTVSGCGSKSEVREPVADEVDANEAEREARSVIEEAYGSLRRGKPEGLLPLLAEDLFVAGPRIADVGLARSDAVVALTAALDVNRKPTHKVKSRDLSVVAAAGGRSAWATDQLEIDGVAFAMTAVVAQIDDLWVITAVHVARAIPDKQLAKQVKAGTLARPAPLAAAAADPAARPLITLVTEAANDPAKLLDQLGSAGDVIAIGTAPRAVAHGPKKIRKAWKKRDKKKATFTSLQGEPTIGVGADGAHAWVLANVDFSRGGDDDKLVAPHRAFFVYAQGADGWELVVFHDAIVF